MENVLKIDLKWIFHSMIYFLIIAICFVLFIRFTQQSVNNSLIRDIENQNNHAIFVVNY